MELKSRQKMIGRINKLVAEYGLHIINVNDDSVDNKRDLLEITLFGNEE